MKRALIVVLALVFVACFLFLRLVHDGAGPLFDHSNQGPPAFDPERPPGKRYYSTEPHHPVPPGMTEEDLNPPPFK